MPNLTATAREPLLDAVYRNSGHWRAVVRIQGATSTCSFHYFLYSCCWKVCSGLAAHSGLAAEMRLLRDVTLALTASFEIHQTCLFSSRDCCTHVKHLVPLHLRIHGFQMSVTREASTTPVQVPWESRAGCCPVCFLLRGAACGRDPCSAPPEQNSELLFTDSTDSLFSPLHRKDTPVLSDVFAALAQAVAVASLVMKHEKHQIQFAAGFGNWHDGVCGPLVQHHAVCVVSVTTSAVPTSQEPAPCAFMERVVLATRTSSKRF